jgi:hypothetical protein
MFTQIMSGHLALKYMRYDILARGSMSMVGRRLDLVDGHRARLQYFSSLPYPRLIQEYVLRLSEEEALQGSFHLSPCQWTRLISS